MKNKKGAIEDFGELAVTTIIIMVLMAFLFYYINSLQRNHLEWPDLYANDLEALQTTRIILEWDLNEDEQVYERVIKLYNENNKREIIYLIESVINKEFEEPGKWVIAVDEFSPEQVHGGVDLSGGELIRFEGVRKFLPKTTIPNHDGAPIKMLIKKVTGGDYLLINRARSTQEIIEIAHRSHDADAGRTQTEMSRAGPE